jgi:hypothetical protein
MPESGLGFLLLGAVIACGTLALVILGRLEASWPAYAVFAAGAALGLWLFRFGTRHVWVAWPCLLGVLVVSVVFFGRAEDVGPAGVAWLGGFVAATHVGVAWRIAATRRKPTPVSAA